jgi:hypothetical protein
MEGSVEAMVLATMVEVVAEEAVGTTPMKAQVAKEEDISICIIVILLLKVFDTILVLKYL